MDPLHWLSILMGLGVLVLLGLAVLRGEFREIERPKYEMLRREPPREEKPAQPGRMGIEDRILRFGLVTAALYYADRVGWTTPLGLLLICLAFYVGVTALLARDYLYKIFKIDTRLPEHRF
ncbi:MAG: hypothetical protein NZ610_08195 [Candidatus Bipolaricaulota bacterium]|nr:hypothetical protein [Candidatus Bipolaricaulota bacterium]MCS7275357.1 hypothetical protein [Candidatus Bipolaricaulota bacterium]MDW8110144.1 hypothetical protein [Candidatus Bipolaricaulota bacterium]MDW8329649.1 hypothetical protein [Candidatus Bipolaricaulota bacterium]